jgi:predicted methyltransferase
VLFMGDSDGIALGLITSAHRGMVPSPLSVTVCDFDDRVLRFIEAGARSFGCTASLIVQRYNVFDPLPPDLRARFDFFHTNPPYGMYNAGRSITAFVDRCIAGIRPSGEGIVVLGNDPRREWTMHVLRAVLSYLVERGVTPTRILQRVHRYVLDDDPELESGFVYCRIRSPYVPVSGNLPLPDSYIESFYGRESIRIPAFIDEFGIPVYNV